MTTQKLLFWTGGGIIQHLHKTDINLSSCFEQITRVNDGFIMVFAVKKLSRCINIKVYVNATTLFLDSKNHDKSLENYLKLQALTEKGNVLLLKEYEMHDFAKGEFIFPLNSIKSNMF